MLIRLDDDDWGDIGGVGMLGVLLRLDVLLVVTVSSSGPLETLTGRGRCRGFGLISCRMADRGSTLGGVGPLVRRDSGRKVKEGEGQSMLATTMMGEMVNVGGI